ncbi:very short patch repair endonuclease [Pandoraea apista]|uniref:Very short patch repair endonuclease n=1 Tax=Pandoraea apista TaxID=93218 RepID=A0ABX9ZH95_9BURK|nr:very short patch repair endonuclease [Pandoraea apista]PTD98317.1 very short patch repair endonuclease [Pandoraea apista]RRJ25713.1 DNA mismatch endonuclease Vsr [Pandoraea apista]RRJ72806.1 DNA mismatch endonuclease Vsr [Pandoraea apista]RSC97461.1 DNA mismatch endonuclease Vsr [Pandoraea apista]RSD07598.1 DNA mismatch endonuclease Vsr [Pandoraea apista]
MDRLSTEHRSWLMSRVGAKNTAPELAVRKLLFSMGYRYRLHGKALPGRPDIVFPGRRKVIFVNGCFWHGHESCRYGRLPRSRIDFWADKIARNRERDSRNVEQLRQQGWRTLTVWQCELKNFEELAQKLYDFLEDE